MPSFICEKPRFFLLTTYIIYVYLAVMVTSTLDFALGPPLEQRGLQRTVYERIRKGILTGAFAPGGQIKIGELAAALDVSANPVREALRQLEAEGMVRFSQNKKIEVFRLSLEDLNDIYSIMVPLEEIALEKCFNLIDGDGVEELKTFCKKMMKEDLSGSEWMELNWMFHRNIHNSSGSPRLAGILKGLRANITPYLHISFGSKVRIYQANLEHQQLLQALEENNIEQGRLILRSHLSHGCAAIGELMEKETGCS